MTEQELKDKVQWSELPDGSHVAKINDYLKLTVWWHKGNEKDEPSYVCDLLIRTPGDLWRLVMSSLSGSLDEGKCIAVGLCLEFQRKVVEFHDDQTN